MSSGKPNAPVSHTASELVRTKGQLLLHHSDLSSSLSSLDHDISRLHSLLSSLKSTEQQISSTLSSHRSHTQSSLSSSTAVLRTAIQQLSAVNRDYQSYPLSEVKLGVECVRLYRELGDVDKSQAGKHDKTHGRTCQGCSRPISTLICPFCH